MSLTSTYEIDLRLQDNSKDAIRSLEEKLKGLSDIAKNTKIDSMAESLNDAEKAANNVTRKVRELAKNSELDAEAVIKAYSKSSQKTIGELEKQYSLINEQKKKALELEKRLNELVKAGAPEKERLEAQKKLLEFRDKLKISSIQELDDRMKQNRQIRANLKATEVEAQQTVKYEKAMTELKKMQAKQKKATDKAEKKALEDKIKQQKAYIKAIEQTEKITKKTAEQTGMLAKAWGFARKGHQVYSKVLQNTYNKAGLIGGAGRLMTGGIRAASSGLNMVSQASDRALERERAVNRVKGMDANEANELLGKIYVQTGADYSTIVEAINRVRGVLKGSVSDDDLVQAAAIEIRYPGMALAFASSTTEASMASFNVYANRMKAIQNAAGASDEQIQASTQKMANYNKRGAFKNLDNASITEMQAVYLGLQNSGAFESQDELDTAFDRFIRDRRSSNKPAWQDAMDYDWTKTTSKSRDKLQISNTLQSTMDWWKIASAASEENAKAPEKTAAEKTAEKMRALEEKRNEMMIKLVDVLEPIIDAISKVITDGKMDKIIEGAVNLLSDVVPLLSRVLAGIGEFIVWITTKLTDYFDDDDDVKNGATVIDAMGNTANNGLILKNANGGLALMPSIVGERGPEAIIPLDFARSQRASNIATSINQTFNMGSNATTALSLAQTVRSRDFTRAMAENAFITRRCGVF